MEEKVCGLNELCTGQGGRIVGMYVPEEIGQRLRDMGFMQGVRIERVYGSPFGDPVAYFVKGTLIALRNRDAEMISVELIETESGEVKTAEIKKREDAETGREERKAGKGDRKKIRKILQWGWVKNGIE